MERAPRARPFPLERQNLPQRRPGRPDGWCWKGFSLKRRVTRPRDVPPHMKRAKNRQENKATVVRERQKTTHPALPEAPSQSHAARGVFGCFISLRTTRVLKPGQHVGRAVLLTVALMHTHTQTVESIPSGLQHGAAECEIS